MKILFFQPFGDGGIAHYSHNLLTGLAASGVEARLFTTADYEFEASTLAYPVERRMFSIAVRLQRRLPWLGSELPGPSLLRRMLKLCEYPFDARAAARLAASSGVDAVHVQTVQLTELLLVWLLKRRGVRVVFTVHNVLPLHRAMRPHQQYLLRRLYALCDALVIHTASGKADVTRLFGVDPEKIHVIPHGDYKFFVGEARRGCGDAKAALGIPRDARTVLFFGAIRRNKGLDTLIAAAARLVTDFPTVTLMIVGEPCEDYGRYRELIRQSGLERRVFERLAYVPNEEVGGYFEAADVVVLPYHEVTQSGVLQIAFAFGRPVIATSLGGLAETIEHGVTGWLVPPRDATALADRIAEVFADREGAAAAGQRARRLADSAFSWEDIARRTMALYAP